MAKFSFITRIRKKEEEENLRVEEGEGASKLCCLRDFYYVIICSFWGLVFWFTTINIKSITRARRSIVLVVFVAITLTHTYTLASLHLTFHLNPKSFPDYFHLLREFPFNACRGLVGILFSHSHNPLESWKKIWGVGGG